MEDMGFKDFCNMALPSICSFVCFIILLAILILFGSCDNRYKRENERLREELARQQQYVPLHKDTIRDTVEVVTQKVVEVEKIKEVLSKEDKQLIKDLGMKAKELESYQKTGIETRDTVYLTEKDSTNNAPLIYHDAWTDLEYSNRKLVYAMRDSLAIALKKEYKHRFLFFRWGTKGYDVKVVNFNPHSTIRYNTFVKSRD